MWDCHWWWLFCNYSLHQLAITTWCYITNCSKFIGFKQQSFILTQLSVFLLIFCWPLWLNQSALLQVFIVSRLIPSLWVGSGQLCAYSFWSLAWRGIFYPGDILLMVTTKVIEGKLNHVSPPQAFVCISSNIPLAQANHMVEHKVKVRSSLQWEARQCHVAKAMYVRSSEQLGLTMQSTISP